MCILGAFILLSLVQSEFYEREVVLADRDCVETGADQILEHAKDDDVAFLVVGDPLWYATAGGCRSAHT